MSTDNSDKIAEFVRVTNIDSDRAKFYLESANNDLQVALSSFFEEGENDDPVITHSTINNPPNPIQSASTIGSTASKPSDAPSKVRTGVSSQFATLATLNKSSDGDSSDSEEGQAYYAGGSETSGQQIVGPGKKSDNMVSKMFKAAREHGAEVMDEGVDLGSTGGRRSLAFGGAGYRLGTEADEPIATVPVSSDGNTRPKKVPVVLKMWRNGFSIDNGPLRDYNDEANREFLSFIMRGEIPRELHRDHAGSEVNLTMEDHRGDEYRPPTVVSNPFTGTGNMLGSCVPNITTNTVPDGDNKTNEDEAQRSLAVDPSQPVTSVQVRLADGSRVVIKLNHTHTVQDIRNYIQRARPSLSGRSYVLMTTFPNKELQDLTTSVKDGNLLNAVVVHKFQ